MNLSPPLAQPCSTIPASQPHSQHLDFPFKKKQMENADSHSRAASISENIRGSYNNNAPEPNFSNTDNGKLQCMVVWGWLCGISTAIQFSILIGLILIQYISSIITLPPLLVALLLVLALHPSLIVLTYRIQVMLQQHHIPSSSQSSDKNSKNEGSKEDSQIPTIPKINREPCKRGNAKTKKMQYPNLELSQQKNTEQTIRKEVGGQIEHPFQLSIFRESFNNRKDFLLVLKSIQLIMEIAVASFSITSFANNDSFFRTSMIVLSVAAYVLVVASSIIFIFFLKQIGAFFRPGLIRPTPELMQVDLAISDHHQPKTKISIDQLMPKSMERKKTFSIEQGFKSVIHSEDQESEAAQQREFKSEVERQAAIKNQIKRSVLKPSKVHQNKSRKTSEHSVEEEIMERRKVQINSKKIQYFEYCEISPSQSVVGDEESSKCKANKSKLNAQRIKYVRQRMEAEARILSNKVMARENKAKSVGCLSNPNRQAPTEEEPSKIDHFL